jgi:hypothetical protein
MRPLIKASQLKGFTYIKEDEDENPFECFNERSFSKSNDLQSSDVLDISIK